MIQEKKKKKKESIGCLVYKYINSSSSILPNGHKSLLFWSPERKGHSKDSCSSCPPEDILFKRTSTVKA